MHAPDGFLDAPASAAMGLVAAGGVAVALRRAGHELDERAVPLAGLTAAFVFAVQMLNFPVAGGTSGHLLGGVLAAVLVGPWLGALCVTVVVVVQALLFADGGLTALGTNVVNMALVTALGGYLVFLALRRLLPRTRTGVAVASGVAAGVGVVLSSVAFSLEYAVGGAGGASPATVTTAMVGVHVLIGLGEGLITALTVSAVLAVRPDLVHGAREVTSDPSAVDGARPAGALSSGRVGVGTLVVVGLALAVALAFAVAPEASGEPDGLERVATDEGFADQAGEHALADSPTADYGVEGVDDPRLGTGLAGALGIALTFLATAGLVLVVRRRKAAPTRATTVARPT